MQSCNIIEQFVYFSLHFESHNLIVHHGGGHKMHPKRRNCTLQNEKISSNRFIEDRLRL